MLQRATSIGIVVLLLGALVVPSWAEDEEQGEGKAGTGVDEPSPLADLREEHLQEETAPVDPIEYLRSFRDWIAEHDKVPPRTAKDSTLYDVWTAALKSRTSRMIRRLDTMMNRKYWLPETGAAVRVKPEHWSRFTRELAGLASELHGAWSAYSRVKVRDRQLVAPRRRHYGYVGYGYPVARWRSALYGRQAVVYHGGGEMNSYWNLMNRYRRGWGWRSAVCYECEQHRKELQKRHKETVAEKRRVIETTRDTLEQQMLSLQLLAAAMQAQEEHSLRAELDALPADDLLRAPAEDVLASLRDARLKAERYSGSGTSQYGQLLRAWVRTYKAGGKLLEKEEKKLEADAAAGRDDDG